MGKSIRNMMSRRRMRGAMCLFRTRGWLMLNHFCDFEWKETLKNGRAKGNEQKSVWKQGETCSDRCWWQTDHPMLLRMSFVFSLRRIKWKSPQLNTRDSSARRRSQVERKRGRRARRAHSSVLSLKMLDRIRSRFRLLGLFFFFYLFYISYFRFGSALLVCIRRQQCACFRRCNNDGSFGFLLVRRRTTYFLALDPRPDARQIFQLQFRSGEVER